MADWRNCIVSYIDLIGIKEMFASEKQEAVAAIQQLHSIIYGAAQVGLTRHAHAYSWNDSALLLAYCDQGEGVFEAILREVDDLKKRIDREIPYGSYAIAVKGMAIPEPAPYMGHAFDTASPTQTRHVYIKASSMAFANCFKIEEKLGPKYKDQNILWYVDERIARHLTKAAPTAKASLAMLPDNKKRVIFMYDGFLWR